MSNSDHPGLSEHAKGLLIVATGVLILTPDALLLRLIEADPWTLLFWRGIGFFSVQMTVSACRHGGCLWRVIRATGWIGVAIMALHGVTQLLFVYSINHTLVANTLVIIAASPLAAALLAWLLLGERTPPRTLIAGGVALAAVALTVGGGYATGGLAGDLAALALMLVMALIFVLLRKAKARNMLPAVALSGLVTAALALPFAPTLAVTGNDLIYLPILVGLVVPISFILISSGPRYLPAPEVGLLMLVETVLGPLWVWFAFAEEPTGASLVGGGIIILALGIHSWIGLRAERRRRRPPAAVQPA
ncbi:MAG: EamA family transporter [Geminicoccaceae bacterium]|nr:EamA family transporter [Geminicoccaceae bacterium]MCB9966601.1 EamA family transporter [Geminicoccaceae bacterium]HRY25512.1 EamA family transporter [Geminicoccaceae bacterium]